MCNRSHQMYQFSFSFLKLQSKSTHGFCHFIKCTIRLFHHHRHKYHYYQKKILATVMPSLSIELDRLSVSVMSQCGIGYRAILCFAVDTLSPFHWSPTNVQCLVFLHKRNVFHCTKHQHRRYILKQTRSSLFTCVRGSRWHIDLIPRGRMTKIWRQNDIAASCRWPIVCFFLSVQTSL